MLKDQTLQSVLKYLSRYGALEEADYNKTTYKTQLLRTSMWARFIIHARFREIARIARNTVVGDIRPPPRSINQVNLSPKQNKAIGGGPSHGNYFVIHNSSDHSIFVDARNWHNNAVVSIKITPHDTHLIRGADHSSIRNPDASKPATAEYFSVANWGDLEVLLPPLLVASGEYFGLEADLLEQEDE